MKEMTLPAGAGVALALLISSTAEVSSVSYDPEIPALAGAEENPTDKESGVPSPAVGGTAVAEQSDALLDLHLPAAETGDKPLSPHLPVPEPKLPFWVLRTVSQSINGGWNTKFKSL